MSERLDSRVVTRQVCEYNGGSFARSKVRMIGEYHGSRQSVSRSPNSVLAR
jgi:hypothetical protein